jgi:hypothetical protein
MTEVSSSGAIADHHTTLQYRAGTAYPRTLNVVIAIPGGGGSSYLGMGCGASLYGRRRRSNSTVQAWGSTEDVPGKADCETC